MLLGAGLGGMDTASAQTPSRYSLTVPMEVERDSNPSMAVVGSPAVTWLRVRPNLTAAFVRGSEEFVLDAGVVAEKSSNEDVAQNRVDPRLRAAWNHEDAINRTQLALEYDRRSFRTLGVDEHVPTGTDGARTLFALSGQWTRELGERTAFTADLRQDWEQFTGSGTQDFRHTLATARLTRQQQESRSFYALVTAELYRPDSDPAGTVPSIRSTVWGALGGIQQRWGDAFTLDAKLGLMHFADPVSDDDWQGTVHLDYQGERWRSSLTLLRAPAVNTTFGGLVVNEEVRLALRYDFTALTWLELDGGYSRQRAAHSKRLIGGATLTHQWAPAWQLALRASSQEQEGIGGGARSNRLSLVLIYTNPDL